MKLDKESVDRVIAAIMSAACNKILDRGMKREWELMEARTVKRRQSLKNLVLKERRENEEARLIRLVQ